MKPLTARLSSSPAERTRSATTPERMLEILVSPGEVFEEAIAAPHATANWLLPVLLNGFCGVLLFLAVEGRMSSTGGMEEEAQVARAVAEDSSEQVHASSRQEGGQSTSRFAVMTAIVLVPFAGTFWSMLVLGLIGRVFLRTRFSWLKTLEIAGLTTVLLALGTVVTALLIMATDNGLARPAVSLLIGEFDPANRIHRALAGLDVFHVWTAAVLSIGLTRLSGVSNREAAVWVFGYWIALRITLLLLA